LYRLDRVREILGRDLEDSDERLSLQIALRIRGAVPLPLADPRRAARRVVNRRKRAG